MEKIKTIDVFAGCGGLTEGFCQTGFYETKACVEWESAQCKNLRKRLSEKWKISDADERVIQFDIRRIDELISGFSDPVYGESVGLDALVGDKVDLVIGGPPCQAYSIAGRIRDEHGMKNDYRNYLFESYLKVVDHYKPRAFIFENVPGILSAKPGDTSIVELIHEQFAKAGYVILPDLRDAVINISKYGVSQRRKRVIILGLRKEIYHDKAEELLEYFYNTVLPSYQSEKELTVMDAIGDLPKLYPIVEKQKEKKKLSHSRSVPEVKNHIPRFHNDRDIEIFRILASDIETGVEKYIPIDARKKLYTDMTGLESNIHKYNVLRWNHPSNTIPAHLNKDGLRHIHPDSVQARSITVREAARLQTFPDDYEFIGAQTEQYKMIGNAVPPEFARRLASALKELLF
jgi:DNA (cytosine-5)-methyltransferase 1